MPAIALDRGAAVVDRLVHSPEPVYGVSTGFGALANTVIPPERSEELQLALIRSHAAGLGAEVEREAVRAMMLLRARSLSMGYSGARAAVVESIVALLNAGITPVVPEYGSLGASGDLAPLASAALVLLGEGAARRRDGTLIDGVTACREAGVAPLALRAKEGLALINGTDGMLGMVVLALADLDLLLVTADIAGAMSTEALMGTDRAFAEDLLAMRPQVGQQTSAANLRALLAGSPIVASHRYGDDRVQDAYSLRCTPQVHGAARDTVEYATAIADRELRSFIDNPVVLPDGRVESCGNFHGAPIGAVADFLAISIADVAAISERRTDRMLDRSRSHGLPPFLSPDAGVNFGLDDRPLHAGGDGGGEPPPRGAGEHGHAADERDAGGPRVTRLVGGAQAAHGSGQPGPCPRRRADRRVVGARVAGTAGTSNAVPERLPRRCAPSPGDLVRTCGSRRASPRSNAWSSTGRCGRRPTPCSQPICGERGGRFPPLCHIGAVGAGARPVRAPRGSQLSCRGWPQEAAYRMLQNNLDPEVAERPDDLVVYGGTGRAARSWEAFDAMLATLRTLGDDETMLVQSGKPVGVFRTHEWAPRVLLANSNLVPDWATWDEFRRLEAAGLTMYGQMTAGSWIYIGTQGILQGTYECFAEIARRRFGGTLAGTITLTAGLGGMGGAQPLAITMNDGVALVVEVDPARAQRRVDTRYLDVVASDFDDAVTQATKARDERRGLSIGLVGNAAEMLPRLLEADFPADIVTDQTSAHDPLSYVPVDITAEAAAQMALTDPGTMVRPRSRVDGRALRGDGRLPRPWRRGLRLRQQPARRGRARRLRPRLRLPRVPACLHPPAVLRGQGPVPVGRPVGRSGRHRDDGPGGAGGVPGGRGPGALDPAGG